MTAKQTTHICILPHNLLLTHKWQKPELISCWAESLRDSTFPIASNSSNNCMHCNFLKNQAIKLKYGFARNTDRSIGEWITIEIYLTRLNLCQMCLEILGITNTVKQAETCTRLNRSMKNSSMLMTYLERTAWANFCCWNKTCVLDWCKLHSGWWYACCGWTSFALRQGRDGAVTQRPGGTNCILFWTLNWLSGFTIKWAKSKSSVVHFILQRSYGIIRYYGLTVSFHAHFDLYHEETKKLSKTVWV